MAKAAMKRKFPVGTRIEAKDGDSGIVVEAIGRDAEHPMAKGDNVFVAWSSGVSTWTPCDEL